MAQSELELRILEALERVAPTQGIDIVDVEVGGSGRAPVVRIRIDHADESLPIITLDEIGEQSRWIDSVIDEIDPFADSYTLEVSSPGMDRPLRRPRDFARFAGDTVVLVTTAREGRRRYTGTLIGMEHDRVALSCDGTRYSFDPAEIRSCKIKPDYDAVAKARTERKR